MVAPECGVQGATAWCHAPFTSRWLSVSGMMGLNFVASSGVETASWMIRGLRDFAPKT